LRADATCDLFDGLDKGSFEGFVDRRVQRGDRTTRLVERALRRRGEPSELALLGLEESLGKRAGLRDDERQLLRQAVVQVAGNATALVQDCRSREPALIPTDLADGADEDQEIRAEPEDVGGVEPLRIERREEQVVEPREAREGRARGEPRRELVAR